MSYPDRLLSKPTDVFIDSPEQEEHLCRWTRPEFPLKDKEGKLTATAIEGKRLFHYSMNKIPHSEIEDIFIEFYDKKRFLEPWKKDMPIIKITEDDYETQSNRGYFFLKIGDIHEHIGTYPFPPKNDDDPHNCEFLVKVVHAPVRANFMHFELHVFDKEGNLLSEIKKKKWRRIIVAELRQHIIQIAKFDL